MLLQSGQPYAAKIVEAPFVSDRPESRNLVVLVAAPIIGAAVAIMLLLTLVVLFRTSE